MKISFISCANIQCGIGRYSEELSQALVTLGHEVNGFRKEGANDLFQTYPYRSFKQLRHYVAPYYLQKAIKNEQTTILQADYVDAAFAVNKQLLEKQPARLFTTVHDAIPFLFPQSKASFLMYKHQLKKAAELSEKLIVVSKKSKQDLIEQAGISPEKIKVVYNGINHDMFYADPVKVKNDVFTIRYIGGLGGYKNVESIIHMAKLLQDWNIPVRIEIGGGHPESTGLSQLSESLGLKNVFFRGFIPNSALRSFLATADLFVYASLYEGFGFPPLEAMACGTATISSNRGSLEEVLKWGAMVTEPTPKHLAEAVREVFYKPQTKASLENRAVQVAKQYTWENAAKAMTELYEQNQFTTLRKSS